jgi:nitroimidazol reductase NimA-like FMN-containing flavoprotein (pyridoxamine 5'-phosphate oxidase superfamily)
MRQNPLVCAEADEIRDHDDWESIVLLGRYVEISSGALSEQQIARFVVNESSYDEG